MTNSSYTWFDPGGRGPEQARLERQALLYDPITRHMLEAAGVTAGMRVLDLGSGAGDVALMLSDIVGPDGSVLGVEVDADAVAAARTRSSRAGVSNVEFIQGDVTDMHVVGPFDAVVGRLILMYVKDPIAVVRDVADLVRPGGLVVFMEISWAPLAKPDTPLFSEIATIIGAAFERTGAQTHMGERLHVTFRSAGLAAPQLILESPAGGSERPLSEYVRDELVGLLPLLERERLATADQLDLGTLVQRLDADTERTGGIVTLWPMTGAWSRV